MNLLGKCTNVTGLNEGSMLALNTQTESLYLFIRSMLINDLLGTVFTHSRTEKVFGMFCSCAVDRLLLWLVERSTGENSHPVDF